MGREMWPQLPLGSSTEIDWSKLVDQFETLKYVSYGNITGFSELLFIECHTI